MAGEVQRADGQTVLDGSPLDVQRVLESLRPEPALPPLTRHHPEPAADLHLATVDVQGRVPLRRAAAALNWSPNHEVIATVDESVLRLASRGAREFERIAGVMLALDRRLRLQLPYGLRAMSRFRPGVRLLILAVRPDGVVAVVPVSDLIGRLADHQ